MVGRMAGPTPMSASVLSAETGVSQATLSRWLKQAATMSTMSEPNNEVKVVKRPQDWPAAERLRVVQESSGLAGEALGALLRREGLHEVVLLEWRQAALSALTEAPKRRGRTPEAKTIRKLEAELRRKDRALAETAALLVLQGKARALWGEEGERTAKKKDKKSSS